MAFRVAILDDYQRVATRRLGPPDDDVEVVPFREHVADEDELAARLAGFDCVVAMRERTSFGASLPAKLPQLRLLVTTGMWNAAIDLDAARAAASPSAAPAATATRPPS